MGKAGTTALTLLAWCALATCPALAQGRAGRGAPPLRQAGAGAGPTNCEHNILTLEGANNAAGKDGLIILVARLGGGEKRHDLNSRRLHNARAYLTEYVGLRAPETIVAAEGERTGGLGRIDIYVGGKLYSALTLRRNADLIVGSCEPEELDDARQRRLRLKLFPWRDGNRRRRAAG